jgi:hypothetical protein
MLAGLLVTLKAMRQLVHAWILARRAAGHDQRTGVLARVFAACVILAVLAFNFWFFVMKGPGSGWTPPIGKGW